VRSARLLSRIALLLLAGVGLAALTAAFVGAVQTALPNPGWQAERRHRPAAPGLIHFAEFVGALGEVALFAVGGRLVFRLRLSPAPRNEGQPILLGLRPAGAKSTAR